MAIQCSFSPLFTIHQSAASSPLRKPVSGMGMLPKTVSPVKKAPKFVIRSSSRDQVFEDHSAGIICYKDGNGEIICEGLDEGPRLCLQYPPMSLPMRADGGMLDLLQQRWLETDGETANCSALLGKLGVHSINGSNSLH